MENAEEELMESVVIAILLSNGKGYSFATIEMEYEWKPLRCATCKSFDHTKEKCPKLPKEDVLVNVVSDGFTEVKKKKNKPKHVKQVEGATKTNVNTSVGVPKPSSTNVKNLFIMLSENEMEDTNWDLNEKLKESSTILNESDRKEVEKMVLEGPNGCLSIKIGLLMGISILKMQRSPSLMRLQMMLETRTTRFQTTIKSEEVFGYILLVIKKLTLKKLDD
ncbi:hypothetical protein Tco_1077439 [Tanacetum coccineum]